MPKKFIVLFPVALQLTLKSGRPSFYSQTVIWQSFFRTNGKQFIARTGFAVFPDWLRVRKKAFFGPQLNSVFIKLSLLRFSEPV
jgi:hypothetical protein